MARQEDFLFAERVLQHGYATEEQVQECLSLLERLRGEMKIEESLPALMVKKGYLAPAQANVLEAEIDPNRAGRPKNAIEGYRLLERIGSGAMGSVYKADHLKLQVPVALKVLRPSLASSRTQIGRLKREAQLAARLSHPNVVRSLDVGESNGFHYLAMEFVEGTTVRDLLAKGRIPEKEALAIVRQVASGLAHAHAHGVVHRDVKPGNIMLTRDGTAKLGDFGLARGEGPSDLTLEHASIGTPQYVAPEQMRRGSDATPRSDLFSLGSTLYHMVTGRPPFDGENLGEIVQNVLVCHFEPPERLVPELSRDTVYVIDRLMRANPRERYASAAELVADLERIGSGEHIAPPDFLGDYQAFLRKRRARRNTIVTACAIVVVAAGAFLVIRARNEARQRDLVAFCAVSNATRSGDIDSLDTGPELAAAMLEMRQADSDAASAGCPDAEVAGLRARLRAAGEDAKSLASAEKLLALAKERGAGYRDLDAKLEGLKPSLRGVRARIGKIRDDVRTISDEDALSRYTRQRTDGFLDIEGAKREAGAFAGDLETRYLPLAAEWVGDVAQAPRLIEDLERRWKGVTDLRTRFDEELRAPQPRYNVVEGIVANLRREESAALAPILANTYLRKLSIADAEDRARKLDDAERREWHDHVLPAVDDRIDGPESRPDDAEEHLLKFQGRAKVTLGEVQEKLRDVRKTRENVEQQQESIFRSDEDTCVRRLRERLYMGAYEAVESSARSGRWVARIQERYRELRDRAQRMTELNARFLERVRGRKSVFIGGEEFAGSQVERAPGDDKDRFVARNAKGTREFRLLDLDPRIPGSGPKDPDQLESILAFGQGDRGVAGWFHAAEAYRWDLKNPYKSRELRGKALNELEPNDPWAAEVGRRLEETDKRILDGEARAQQADGELTAALEARENVKAFALCVELMDTLGWTKYTDAKLPYYREKRGDLERLARGGLLQHRAGVPKEQFSYGGSDRETTITFTGRKWHPDESAVAEDAPDRETRLDQLTDEYWTRFYRSQGIPESEIRRLVPRAKRQLLLWSGPVEAIPEGGYRPGAEALLADSLVEWMGAKPTKPREIGLAFPFRPDREWSIEFEVTWPGEPGYFVVAAGRIQAVIGYRSGMGGMSGACLLLGEDLDPNAHLKELGDLHWHMVHPPKGEKPPHGPTEGGEKAYLDETNFVEGVPYRMRLERTEGRIRFEMRPAAGREDRLVHLEKKDRTASQLEKDVTLPDGRRLFRFSGVPGKGLAYELRSVTIRGIVVVEQAEAGKQ